MKIVTKTITIAELKQMAEKLFGNMVKAVVDVKTEAIALDAELHSDLEALLLDNGSKQKDLWGINLYPDLQGQEFVEYDSLINIRPSQNNKIRGIADEKIRKKINDVVAIRIKR